MTRRRITASASARAIACGYWLDDAVELPVEEDLTGVPDEELDELELARREGDKLHALLEHDDGTSDDSRVRAARTYLAEHCPQGHEREHAFGWDGSRARFLGVGREVYDTHPDCTVTGTADIVADLGGGHWLVADWKSGEHGARHAREQLWTLGALVLAAFGGSEAILHAVHLEADQPARVFDHGSIDAMDGAGLLHELHTRTPGPPGPGEHCGFAYCPLRGRCPAFVEASEQALTHAPIAELVRERRNPLTLGIVDDETARVGADLLPMVEARVKRLKADLREYAARQPGEAIDLLDGRRFAKITFPKSSTNAAAALALAEKSGANVEDLAACMRTTQVTQWKRIGTKRKAAS